MMTPFCSSGAGGSHETDILSGPEAITLKLVGGPLGPTAEKL